MLIFKLSHELDTQPELVIFPVEMESPWVCFNLGDRKFGIWIHTLNVYEADEHGAMGEDPIMGIDNIDVLKPDPRPVPKPQPKPK